jgi:hypothetical protein
MSPWVVKSNIAYAKWNRPSDDGNQPGPDTNVPKGTDFKIGLRFDCSRAVQLSATNLDNFNKLWADCLSGIVYEDDSQGAELDLFRADDKRCARIEVIVATHDATFSTHTRRMQD